MTTQHRLTATELELLCEVLREHLVDAERFILQLEVQRAGTPTPLAQHVKKRCQRVRALLRHLTPARLPPGTLEQPVVLTMQRVKP